MQSGDRLRKLFFHVLADIDTHQGRALHQRQIRRQGRDRSADKANHHVPPAPA